MSGRSSSAKPGPVFFTQQEIDALSAGRRPKTVTRQLKTVRTPAARPARRVAESDKPAPPSLKRSELDGSSEGPTVACRSETALRGIRARRTGGRERQTPTRTSPIRRSSLPSVPVNVPDVPSIGRVGWTLTLRNCRTPAVDRVWDRVPHPRRHLRPDKLDALHQCGVRQCPGAVFEVEA